MSKIPCQIRCVSCSKMFSADLSKAEVKAAAKHARCSFCAPPEKKTKKTPATKTVA